MAEQEGKTIHSVAKAIRLLDLLTAAGQPASLTELYQKTGWPKSTIHGLLSTMRESGLIEQTPNGRYWLGNVVVNAHRERIWFLEYHADPFAESVDIHFSAIDVFSVQQHFTGDPTARNEIIHSVDGF